MIGGTSNSGSDSIKTKANLGYNDFWLVTVRDTTKNSSIISESTPLLTQRALSKVMMLHPDPVKDILPIETISKARFLLINQEDKIVLSKFITEKGEMNIKGLPAGIYSLKNITTLETTKIIIQ